MLEPYDGKLSRTVLRREGGGNTADPADYSPLVNRLKGQVIKISPNSTQFIIPWTSMPTTPRKITRFP